METGTANGNGEMAMKERQRIAENRALAGCPSFS